MIGLVGKTYPPQQKIINLRRSSDPLPRINARNKSPDDYCLHGSQWKSYRERRQHSINSQLQRVVYIALDVLLFDSKLPGVLNLL